MIEQSPKECFGQILLPGPWRDKVKPLFPGQLVGKPDRLDRRHSNRVKNLFLFEIQYDPRPAIEPLLRQKPSPGRGFPGAGGAYQGCAGIAAGQPEGH
jgi:hypothetical protein